jgi:Methylase of chemotaxis methyl-accepting proteins
MPPKTEDIEIRLLLEAIFLRYHYDFRGYAMTSVKRRIRRAQERFGCESISHLQEKVLHHPEILPDLLGVLTVQASEFFRDPAYFRAIRERVLPHLRTYPSLKVWIAGCSTGEELYSLAILFREEGLEDRTIFYATDINPDALRQARAGVYPLNRMQLFTKNHQKSGGRTSLSEYYTAAYSHARIDPTLRARAVFSDHSLVTDQVFAEVHFISCRNVMIYFDRDLQDRVLGLFRDALIRRGFLGLGAKESVQFSRHAGAFEVFDREEKLYQKAD